MKPVYWDLLITKIGGPDAHDAPFFDVRKILLENDELVLDVQLVSPVGAKPLAKECFDMVAESAKVAENDDTGRAGPCVALVNDGERATGREVQRRILVVENPRFRVGEAVRS